MATLYERHAAVSIPGQWGDLYGGKEDSFEPKRWRDGWLVDGIHQGDKEVTGAIDLFHGVLCRIIRPDHPKLAEAEERAKEYGAEHVGKTQLAEPVVELKERLAGAYEAAGLGKGRVLTGVTGSGMNAMAWRMANGFTRGGLPMYLNQCYHGADYLGNAVVGVGGWRGEHSPTIDGIRHIGRMQGLTPQQEAEGIMSATESADGTTKRPFIFAEDIGGVNGFKDPGKQTLNDLLDLMGRYNGVFINDEIQTGMRRSTYLSVHAWLNRQSSVEKQPPLIITMSKAIANGAPLAAALVPEEIAVDMSEHPEIYGFHWDTFDTNVRTAALAGAVFDVYHEEKLGERTPDVRKVFLEQLEGVKDGVVTGEPRGDGLMIGIVVKDPKVQLAQAVAKAPEFGVVVGKGTDALRIAPLADMPLDLVKEAGERVARLLDSLPKAA